MATSRLCRACGTIKEPAEYRPVGRGLSHACLDCERADRSGPRTCRTCGEAKPLSEFYVNRRNAYHTTYFGSCIACMELERAATAQAHRARARAWCKANPEQARARGARYRRENSSYHRAYAKAYYRRNRVRFASYSRKRKAALRGAEGSFSPADIERIWRQQRGRCAICRKRIRKTDIRRDHIQPVSKGGSNYARNIQLACEPCNASKSAKDPIDFMRERGLLL